MNTVDSTLRSASIIAGITLLAACASNQTTNSDPPPQQSQIQTVQAGDSALTCDGLRAQINNLDAMAQLPSGGGPTNKQVATNVASGTAGRVAAAPIGGAIPVVGGLVSLGMGLMHVSDAETAADKARSDANLRMEATQRKQYLVQLYTQKRC